MLSVDDYVDIVRVVWKEVHPQRTVVDFVLHVLDHASKLGEAIRKEDVSSILKEIAQTTNWLFGLVGRLNDDKAGWEKRLTGPKFSHMIWNKYPNLCPHCFERIYISKEGKTEAKTIARGIKRKCRHCLIDYPKVETRSSDGNGQSNTGKLKQLSKDALRDYARSTLKEIPHSLQEMETMFHDIYTSSVALATVESIGFHLLEETGEMGRAVIDIYSKWKDTDLPEKEKLSSLSDEIAEVFAWLCSLTLKVREQAARFDKYDKKLTSPKLPSEDKGLADSVGLEKILWVEFRDEKTEQYRCPYCESPVCGCKVLFAWDETRGRKRGKHKSGKMG